VNRVFRSSLEVGVRVEAMDLTGNKRHINSAFFTYVARSREGDRLELPQVMPDTEEDHQRFISAVGRRQVRLYYIVL
jgi:acyl-CoA hydrolase